MSLGGISTTTSPSASAFLGNKRAMMMRAGSVEFQEMFEDMVSARKRTDFFVLAPNASARYITTPTVWRFSDKVHLGAQVQLPIAYRPWSNTISDGTRELPIRSLQTLGSRAATLYTLAHIKRDEGTYSPLYTASMLRGSTTAPAPKGHQPSIPPASGGSRGVISQHGAGPGGFIPKIMPTNYPLPTQSQVSSQSQATVASSTGGAAGSTAAGSSAQDAPLFQQFSTVWVDTSKDGTVLTKGFCVGGLAPPAGRPSSTAEPGINPFGGKKSSKSNVQKARVPGLLRRDSGLQVDRVSSVFSSDSLGAEHREARKQWHTTRGSGSFLESLPEDWVVSPQAVEYAKTQKLIEEIWGLAHFGSDVGAIRRAWKRKTNESVGGIVQPIAETCHSLEYEWMDLDLNVIKNFTSSHFTLWIVMHMHHRQDMCTRAGDALYEREKML